MKNNKLTMFAFVFEFALGYDSMLAIGRNVSMSPGFEQAELKDVKRKKESVVVIKIIWIMLQSQVACDLQTSIRREAVLSDRTWVNMIMGSEEGRRQAIKSTCEGYHFLYGRDSAKWASPDPPESTINLWEYIWLIVVLSFTFKLYAKQHSFGQGVQL